MSNKSLIKKINDEIEFKKIIEESVGLGGDGEFSFLGTSTSTKEDILQRGNAGPVQSGGATRLYGKYLEALKAEGVDVNDILNKKSLIPISLI